MPSLLNPDPFQDHPEGAWEQRYRVRAEEAVADALARHRRGQISEKELRGDRNESGIKFWLWYMHHPPHEVWKKVGRPYWSVDAYESWKRAYFALPESKRLARDGGPSLRTIPRTAAGDDWIIHEHVVPQKVLLDLLIHKGKPVRETLDLNIGAVITKREDRTLPTRSSHPDPSDPWKRYAGTAIRFIPNPGWTGDQERALERYKLVARDLRG